MVFLVRKMRMMPRLNRFKVVVVTDRTDLEGQLRETAQLCGEAVRPTDEDIKRARVADGPTQRILGETHAGHRLRDAAEVSGRRRDGDSLRRHGWP